ncbi:hypothetical protein [Saccharomonospora iraqiensis]|uniref:hypothetical protein n=1 Tax=Saccharomonospora iraqiensis TaxID=52698 RepID=UPI0008085A55|nr:hypothetical protein [Saccharomonospora iraqiensis]
MSRVRRQGSVLGVVLLGVVAGCSGEDLSKVNYERTTVGAEARADGGEVPSGPIDDPAVTQEALRAVDPCALLDGPAVANLTAAEDAREIDWGVCRRPMLDAEGRQVSIWVDLGETNASPSDASGGVGGLPLVELSNDGTCYMTAVTETDQELGISVWADYDTDVGVACDTGTSVLRGVVEVLRTGPPRYRAPAESLVNVDPCTLVTAEMLGHAFDGEVILRRAGLHGCVFEQDRATLRLTMRVGYPVEPEDGTEVALTDRVTAVAEKGDGDMLECDLSWQHRKVAEYDTELVELSYYADPDTPGNEAACERVAGVARGVAAAIPGA